MKNCNFSLNLTQITFVKSNYVNYGHYSKLHQIKTFASIFSRNITIVKKSREIYWFSINPQVWQHWRRRWLLRKPRLEISKKSRLTSVAVSYLTSFNFLFSQGTSAIAINKDEKSIKSSLRRSRKYHKKLLFDYLRGALYYSNSYELGFRKK